MFTENSTVPFIPLIAAIAYNTQADPARVRNVRICFDSMHKL